MSNLTPIAPLPQDRLAAPTAILSHASIPAPILPPPVLTGAQLLGRVTSAVVDLGTRFPALDFQIKPDGGLVISHRSTGERLTDCPYPGCDKGITNKRSNCVSRHFQSTHAPQTLPFVCGGTCSSKTNRRDHFIAHLKRNTARCAAHLLTNATDQDVVTMMRVVYPASKEPVWEVALVRDTNPVHVDAQLRKRGTSLEAIIPGAMARFGMVGYAMPTPAQTPVMYHPRPVFNHSPPNPPTQQVVHPTQAPSPTSDLDSLFAATTPAASPVVPQPSQSQPGASDFPQPTSHRHPPATGSWSTPNQFASPSEASNSARMVTSNVGDQQQQPYAHTPTSQASQGQYRDHSHSPAYNSYGSYGSQHSAPQQPWYPPPSSAAHQPSSGTAYPTSTHGNTFSQSHQ